MIASLYLCSGFFALSVRVPFITPAGGREPVWTSIIQGLKYVKGEQVLLGALVLAVVINLTGWTFHTTLMPIFAKETLGSDSAGLGLLLFVFGIGALCGSFGLAMVRDWRNVGKLLFIAVILWHITILVFATNDNFRIALVILFFTGMTFASAQVFMLTLILKHTLPAFRGRVMGLRVLAIYSFTVGSLATGAIAGFKSAPWAANIVGIVGIGLVILMALLLPKLRQA